jgi:alkanesulfonate monooxygenase SsuD/methylene tetrahydromethanopterin reductase-like flavin-dependent oxidoreductase (luciferase family)
MTTHHNGRPGPIGLGFFVPHARTAVDLISRAERAGVPTAWMVMHPAGYDTPTLAAAALAATTTIRVGTSIVPAFTRHPVALATQVAALSELAPGRFRLGVGSSNAAVFASGFGTPLPRPLAALREYLDVLRAAVETGAVHHHGAAYRVDLDLAAPPAAGSGPVPIALAALGPRMFELAGERADAALSWLCPLDYLDDVARPAVARGAAAVGRPAPPIVTHVTAVVSAAAAEAREIARPGLTGFARSPAFAAMFAGAGLAPANGDGTVPDALVDSVMVHGDEVGLTDRLGALAERQDELLVTLESPAGRRRDDEDVLLRALGNVSRVGTT